MRTKIHDNANPVGNDIAVTLDEGPMEQRSGNLDRTRSSHVLRRHPICLFLHQASSLGDLSGDGIRLHGVSPSTLNVSHALLG